MHMGSGEMAPRAAGSASGSHWLLDLHQLRTRAEPGTLLIYRLLTEQRKTLEGHNFFTFKQLSKTLIFRKFFVWLMLAVISIGKADLHFSEQLKEGIKTNLVCSKDPIVICVFTFVFCLQLLVIISIGGMLLLDSVLSDFFMPVPV